MIKYKEINGNEKTKSSVKSTTRSKSPNPSLVNFSSEKCLYPTHPLRSNICGPSSSGKSVFLTKLLKNVINEYDKIYRYSSSLHQNLYQKMFECFTNFIPIHIIADILNEEDIVTVFDEKVSNNDFQKSDR